MNDGSICVSLPVHTRPAVIAGQLANFAAFLPAARVVLHVSANARFTPAELDAALARAGCANAAVNPLRLPTGWGDILPAHLANIAWIRRHVPACTRICLHSSNDMLVRQGLAHHLAGNRNGSRDGSRNFVQRRPLGPGSRWRFTGAALGDPALQTLCRQLGGVAVLGSQVEGSSYEAALLYEAADLIAPAARQAPPLAYPREEVWLSTVAHALIERSERSERSGHSGCSEPGTHGDRAAADGRPYVFSEVQRFDRVFWRLLDKVDPLIGHRGDARWLPRRALEFLMIRSGFHRMRRRWVDRIARGDIDALARYAWLADAAGTWRVLDAHGVYGVKRVPRRPDAPLRRYIDRLGAAAMEAGSASSFASAGLPYAYSSAPAAPPGDAAFPGAAPASRPAVPPASGTPPASARRSPPPASATPSAPPPTPPLRHPRAHPP